MEIREVGSDDVMRISEQLVALAVDAVSNGAQLGWQNPLESGIAGLSARPAALVAALVGIAPSRASLG